MNQNYNPAPAETTEEYDQNKDLLKKDDIKWNYYEKDNNFLLRFGKYEKNKEEFIRFEVLYTNIISVDKKMFTGYENIEILSQQFLIPGNFDLLTYLAMTLDKTPPEFKYNPGNNKVYLILTNKEDEKKCNELSAEVADEEFFNRNMKRKIAQLEAKLEAKKLEFDNKNKELIEKNKAMKKELESIKNINKNLEKENEKVTKALKDLEEIQKKAIDQLTKIR
jgi:vacuolar-type H+-ATPase subunit I/STV1